MGVWMYSVYDCVGVWVWGYGWKYGYVGVTVGDGGVESIV